MSDPAPATTPAPDVEGILRAMLAEAAAAGESFLDVSSKQLCAAVNDPNGGSGSVERSCRIMKRMMIPGDYDLSSLQGRNRTRLLIRYRLPR